ncbi:MAG: transposase zinc-binding domain-containing protein, partial [Elusimicrobiota bacterium]
MGVALWNTAAKALIALDVLPPGPPEPPAKPESKNRYLGRSPKRSRLRRVVERQLEHVREIWDALNLDLGPWAERYALVAERYLTCGLPEAGFARFRCEKCAVTIRVPFSCKTRLCPSCVRKRMSRWSQWLAAELLLELPHRHWVFTVPMEVRAHFREKRWLLNMLSSTAARVLGRQM